MATESNYFRKELFALWLTGLSIMKDESIGYKVYSYLSLIFINFTYPTLQLIKCLQYNFYELNHMVVYVIGGYGAFARTLIVFRNCTKIRCIINSLEQRFSPKTSTETKFVDACVNITTVQTFGYWILTVVSIIVAALRQWIKYFITDDPNEWGLPFGQFFGLNIMANGRNYNFMLAYQTISAYFMASHFVTVDLITASILCHIAYRFKILRFRLKTLVQANDNEDIFGKTNWISSKKLIKDCVNYHSSLLELVGEMQNVFSNLLLIIMFFTLIMVCFRIYVTTLVVTELNSSQMFDHVTESCACCLQIFMVCFWGERMSEESQKVALAVTEMDFVGCDLRFQKALTLIILKSQRPVTLTAGKFATVGLVTFGWILRSSYSAFIMLKNVNNNRKEMN